MEVQPGGAVQSRNTMLGVTKQHGVHAHTHTLTRGGDIVGGALRRTPPDVLKMNDRNNSSGSNRQEEMP